MSTVLDEIFEGFEPSPEFVSVMAAQEPAAVLGLDIGTSGVRAALFDESGREIQGASARTNRSIIAAVDFERVDADDLVEEVTRTIDDLCAKSTATSQRVEFVAISCFWHSLLGVDGDGHPTTPVLGWANTQVGRAAEKLRARFDERGIHQRTGCRLHPSYWPAKLLWLKEDDSKTYEATKHWLSFAEYLVLRLFGETATSVSMASGTGMLNQRLCEWDRELITALDVSLDSLPEIAAPGRMFSGLRYEYALRWPQLTGAYFFPAIGDGAANSIGSGCVGLNKIALMIGTSGATRVTFEGTPPDELASELWCYRADRSRILIGGALSDGGGLYAWLKNSLALDDHASIELALAEIEPDSHGLTVLPFWAGERSTGWSTSARGAILGITNDTRPLDILRAAIEAVAYRFALIEKLLEAYAPDATIIASGNALRASPVWIQILADVMGREVQLSGLPESSTRGAALLALEATGKIASIEETSVPVEQTFVPDRSRQARYREGLERQQKLYEKLISG